MAKATNETKPAIGAEEKKPEVKKETKPVNSEQAYFNKVSGGHNPNVLENPFSTLMTVDMAKHIVEEKYKGFKGSELPLDLQQARSILKRVNPS